MLASTATVALLARLLVLIDCSERIPNGYSDKCLVVGFGRWIRSFEESLVHLDLEVGEQPHCQVGKRSYQVERKAC